MKKIKNNNSFLVTCVCCVVLLLALCYFGINTTLKGTAATSEHGCLNGYSVVEDNNGNSYCCPHNTDKISVFNDNAYCLNTSMLQNGDDIILTASESGTPFCRVVSNASASNCGTYLDSPWRYHAISQYVGYCEASLSECAVVANSVDEEVVTITYYNDRCSDSTCTFQTVEKVVGEDFALRTAETYTAIGMDMSEFLGWSANDGSTQVLQPGSRYTARRDVTFTTVWRDESSDTTEQCKLTLNLSGGVFTDNTVPATLTTGMDVDCGTPITLPTAVSKQGYTFKGWYTAQINGSQVDQAYVVNSNVTLYAQYNSATTSTPSGGTTNEKTYIFNFNPTGGTIISGNNRETCKSSTGSCYLAWDKVPTVEREDYTFTGWSTGGVDCWINRDLPAAVDTVYYTACWVKKGSSTGDSSGGTTGNTDVSKTYTATFNPNSGTLDGKSSLTCTTKSDKCTINSGLPSASKKDYTFTGWGSSSSCTSGNKNSVELSNNKTFYACYTKNATGNTNTDSEGNVTTNSSTGEIAIALTWFVGLLAIGYSFYYFKNVKQN